jgi:hypothetical protein
MNTQNVTKLLWFCLGGLDWFQMNWRAPEITELDKQFKQVYTSYF